MERVMVRMLTERMRAVIMRMTTKMVTERVRLKVTLDRDSRRQAPRRPVRDTMCSSSCTEATW